MYGSGATTGIALMPMFNALQNPRVTIRAGRVQAGTREILAKRSESPRGARFSATSATAKATAHLPGEALPLTQACRT
jgi:hypothetical protein